MNNSMSFSPTEIDLLYFLFDRPGATEREIMVGVVALKNRVSVETVLKRLKMSGLVKAKQDIIFHLSELAKVLIGKATPNQIIASELQRRGYNNIPIKRVNDYAWGDQKAVLDNAAVHTAKDTGVVALKQHPKKTASVKEITPSKAVKEKKEPSSVAAQEKKVVPLRKNNNGPSNKQRNQFKPLCLNDDEIEVLATLLNDEVINASDLNNNIAMVLSLRKLIVKQDNVFALGVQGEILKHNFAFLPNTINYELSRRERLIVEIMATNPVRAAKMTVLTPALSVHEPGITRKEIDSLLKALERKGVVTFRSNYMGYLTSEFMCANLMGRYGAGAKAKLMVLKNGREIVRLTESLRLFKSLLGTLNMEKEGIGELSKEFESQFTLALEDNKESSTEKSDTAEQTAVEDTDAAEQTAVEDTDTAEQTSVEDIDAAEQTAVEDTDAAEQTAVEDTDTAEQTAVEDIDAAEQTAVEDTDAAEQTAVEETDAAEQTAVEDTDTAEQTVVEETGATDKNVVVDMNANEQAVSEAIGQDDEGEIMSNDENGNTSSEISEELKNLGKTLKNGSVDFIKNPQFKRDMVSKLKEQMLDAGLDVTSKVLDEIIADYDQIIDKQK